jgi:hypothetical protein
MYESREAAVGADPDRAVTVREDAQYLCAGERVTRSKDKRLPRSGPTVLEERDAVSADGPYALVGCEQRPYTSRG